MKTTRYLSAVIVLAVNSAAQADIVFSHLPTRSGGSASDTLFLNSSEQSVWQQTADSITLIAPAVVSQIRWWGGYLNNNPPSSEIMRMRLYQARLSDGLPDSANILREDFFVDPPRTATGLSMSSASQRDEYLYTIDVASALSLNSGIRYWMEIAQIGDIETQFGWEVGSGSPINRAVLNSFSPAHDWHYAAQGGQAFQLIGTPEPSVFALLLLGAILGRRRTTVKRSYL